MSSLINRFLGGIKVYFGREFRYYTIIFFFFMSFTAILTPLFMILEVGGIGNIKVVHVIGTSSALIYLVYMFLTMSRKLREIFFQTKWKYFFAIILPIGGTAGLSFLFIYLTEVIPNVLEDILIVSLSIGFLIWLIVQLFVFGLFIKDVNVDMIEKIEKNEEKKNKRFIMFAILLQIAIIIYFFSLISSFNDITWAINSYLFKFPFALWIFPLAITIISVIILIITLITKKYRISFFSTSYILFYSLYLLYHIAYLIMYVHHPELFLGVINIMSLLFFAFTIFYALQSIGANIKTKLEHWWQPISFFLFTIILLYVTWSITLLYNLAVNLSVDPTELEILFWGINHLCSYLLGILMLVITVFIFMAKKKRKKEVEN